MKYILSLFILIVTVFFCSCNEKKEEKRTTVVPKVQVKVTKVSQGVIPDYLNLTGKTIYLSKNSLMAPINGYITKVTINPGDAVSKGQLLFVIKSREAYAFDQSGSGKEDYGTVYIKAPSAGVIIQQNVFKSPVYVDMGSKLCDIVGTGSLFVEANIPYEFIKYAKKGDSCTILLPDSTSIQGTFSKVLPQMNQQSQTVKVLARLSLKKIIPENLIVTILINKKSGDKTQVLSKQCVMTDALMTKFWVMKLINDSVAIQIPVKPGSQTHDQVEILSPTFKPNDRIISEGAYGLEKRTLVEVIE